MTVELLHNTPLWVCARAIRTCWDSHDSSDTKGYDGDYNECDVLKIKAIGGYVVNGEKDKALIERVGNKNKHKSTLEHLVYTFEIDGISRACLQELARHRMASLSVQSSRYTLAKILKEGVEDSYVSTGITQLDEKIEDALLTIANSVISNDKLKYMLPEAFKTSLVWTINARSLQNFLELRSSKHALWEMQDLAKAIYKALPDEHKYLFKDYINEL